MKGTQTDLHQHLRSWRKRANLTLEQVANKIGSKSNTLSGWELGDRKVDLDDLRKLADLYGVHPAALLFAPPGGPDFEARREADQLIAKMDADALAEWMAIGRRIAPKDPPATE